MDEDKKEAVNEELKTAPEPTPSSEEVKSDSLVQDELEEPSEQSGEPVAEEPEEKPKKQSRAERRISQLLEKNKELREVAKTYEGSSIVQNAEDPLIKPEEYEEGVDPAELQRRIDERVENKIKQTFEQKSQVERYAKVLDTHASDLEGLGKSYPQLDETSDSYVPELAETFIKLYTEVNSDALGNFVPRKLGTEIATDLMKVWGKAGSLETARVASKIVQNASEGAVIPNASGGDGDTNYDLERLKDRATKTGNISDWAEVLKRRI